jgi:energy-coupling factor transport system substrate-specific component
VTAVVRLGRSSAIVLLVASAIGLVAFTWPLFVDPVGGENLAHSGDAPWIFLALLPLLFAVVVAELADGALDAKAIALLGVLAACGAALRLPGGVTGFEPMFFVFIPAGRVFGRGFGFVLGALTMFASALLTGGVGPWLPFQMFAAAWVGFLAGCLPPARGRAEIWLLAGYGFVAGLAYGLIMNMWFWPYGASAGSELSFVPGAGLAENLQRFWAFHLATSLGWDLPRAVMNAVLVLLFGRAVLAALRRVARRAAFGAPVEFAAELRSAEVPSDRGLRSAG